MSSFVAATVLLLAVIVPRPASAAQEVVLPKKGLQFLSTGLSLNPAFLYDHDVDQFPDQGAATVSGGGTFKLGLHQLVTRQLFMSAEAELGLQWMDEHTANISGVTDSNTNLTWQLGLMARWLPWGEENGMFAGVGVHLYRLELDEAALQMLGGDVRFGRYVWSDEENFVLVEFGYGLPLIQGLDLPTDFTGEREPVERTWSYHRFLIGFQYGF